jgi:hypothetical protein
LCADLPLKVRLVSLSRRELLLITAAFLVTRLILVGVGTAVNVLMPSVEGPEYTHLLDGGPALDMWYRWDAGFYTSIATFGYDWFNERAPAADMAFLPVYPLLIHLVSGLTPSGCALSPYWSTCTTIGGLLISNVALLISGWLLFDLTKRRFDARTAWRALTLLLITPNAIFLSGVYTESVFLLWALLTFWLLERRHFYLALIPAGLACLTRSVGVALFPALLGAAWTSGAGRWPRLIAAGLPPALFAGYVLFMGLTAGDPGAYFEAYRSIWGRAAASPIEAFTIYFSGEPVSLLGWDLSWIDLIATGAFLGLGLLTLRLDRAWGLFALTAVLIPIGAGSLLAMPRFGAVVFPFYILIGSWIARARWREIVVDAASIGLAFVFVLRFVTWRWIA